MRDRGAVFCRWIDSRLVVTALGIALSMAWAFFLYRQLPTLRPYLQDLTPLVLFASVGWGATYFTVLSFCWALLLKRMSRTPNDVVVAVAARIWLRSMIARYIPGNIWHIAGRVLLAAQANVSAPLVVASATLEQLMMLLAALGLWLLTLPFWDVLPVEYVWPLLLLPVGLAGLHPRVLNAVLVRAGRVLKQPQLAYQYTYREIVAFLMLYQMAFLCAGFALVTLLMPLVPVSFAAVPFIVGTASLAWVVGFLSFFTPSGLGVREAVLIALLAQQYPLPIAVAASLLFRLALTLGEMLAVISPYGWGRFATRRAPLH